MSRWAAKLGFPEEIAIKIETITGIDELADWQHSCMQFSSAVKDINILFFIPPCEGKSFLSDLLILQGILLRKKSVLMILPNESFANEKEAMFISLALEFNFYVERYTSCKGTIPPLKLNKQRTFYIGSIGGSFTLINSLTKEHRLTEIGMVIIDDVLYMAENSIPLII